MQPSSNYFGFLLYIDVKMRAVVSHTAVKNINIKIMCLERARTSALLLFGALTLNPNSKNPKNELARSKQFQNLLQHDLNKRKIAITVKCHNDLVIFSFTSHNRAKAACVVPTAQQPVPTTWRQAPGQIDDQNKNFCKKYYYQVSSIFD